MVGLVPSPAGTPEGQVPAAATEPWGQEGLVQRGWAGGSLLVGGGTHNQGWPRPLAPPHPLMCGRQRSAEEPSWTQARWLKLLTRG